jgi:hypothetical protein
VIVVNRVFTCEECGLEISSFGAIDERNVCHVCRWITDNLDLTQEERVELRKRLRANPFEGHE